MIAVPALLANLTRVAYAVINVPSYVGFYEHHGSIRYGDQPRQSLDVYAPHGAAGRPVVVFWHGGVWTKGSKEQYRFVGAALANAGYVAVLPDYRLFPQARFPQFIDDGALAVKWAREHASEFGGDPQSIFLMGHSSGAHLATTLALDERYLQKVGGDSSWIRGWIALSAPYELKHILPWMYLMFGTHAQEWQPISLVLNHPPPALLVHGLEDPTIHPQEMIDMAVKLRAAGVPLECRIYDVGHAGTVLAFSPVFRVQAPTLADVQEFIDRTVKAGATSSPGAGSDTCPSLRGRRGWKWGPPPGRPDLMEVP